MKNNDYIKRQIAHLKVGDIFVLDEDIYAFQDYERHLKQVTHVFKNGSKQYKLLSENDTDILISFIDINLYYGHLTKPFDPNTIVNVLVCPKIINKTIRKIILGLEKEQKLIKNIMNDYFKVIGKMKFNKK